VIGMLMAAASGAEAQSTTVPADNPSVAGVIITNAGTYTGHSTSTPARASQLSSTGTVGRTTDWHFVSDAPNVAATARTQCGIEFRIDGTPLGDGITLRLVLAFPPQGIRNPNTGDTMHAANIAAPNMKIGALCILGYGFDNAWEIVLGVWKAQISYRNRMLAERTFRVSKAE
jgi:hypothetical protein